MNRDTRISAGQGYVGLVFSILKVMKAEEHIRSTDRGHHVIALATYLQQHESWKVGVAYSPVGEVADCYQRPWNDQVFQSTGLQGG